MRGTGPEITAIRLSDLANLLTNRHDNTKQIVAEYGSGLSAWSHKPRIAGSNPASATNCLVAQ